MIKEIVLLWKQYNNATTAYLYGGEVTLDGFMAFLEDQLTAKPE